MFYHLTKRVGSGTREDPYRPDVPPDVEWAAHVGATECVVVTDRTLPPATGRVDLSESPARDHALARLGLGAADVRRWLGGRV